MKLNSIMEFEHVIQIIEGGGLIEVDTVFAPEVSVGTDGDGQISGSDERDMVESVDQQGWSLLTGWSGQYRYAGPIMHSAEYIGGGLEEYIRETPGFYCAVVVYCNDAEPAGWAVAYRETV